jgi:hypothetical protein
MVSNARDFRNVGEGAVSIVAEQPAGHRLVDLRDTIVTLSVFVNAARLVLFFTEINELSDE